MLMFCCNKKAKLVMVVILTRKELFMKSKLKKIGVTTLLGVTMFPALAFAGWSQTQYFANFSLGGQKTQYTEFEVTDTSKKYHNNNVTVSNLVHDGDVNNCSFCKLEITGKIKKWYGYGQIGKNTINTPRTGTYAGTNYGEVGTGKFRYYIKNNGAIKSEGTIRVNAQTSEN